MKRVDKGYKKVDKGYKKGWSLIDQPHQSAASMQHEIDLQKQNACIFSILLLIDGHLWSVDLDLSCFFCVWS